MTGCKQTNDAPIDIWRITPIFQGDMVHPNEKPHGLVVRAIQYFGVGAQTIFDPFLGSGTTAVAAKKLGRHFLGFEISPEYCRIAEERIALVEMQPQLFTAPQPQQLDIYESCECGHAAIDHKAYNGDECGQEGCACEGFQAEAPG